MHLGVDNKGAVFNFNRILEGRLKLVRKPWGMRDDGDVWGIVHELVQQRGGSHLKVYKGQGTRYSPDGR